MSSGALGAAVSRRLGPVTDKAAVLALFSGTIFVSALLLFSVQPLFAKLVLPKLGGAPSVWAVSMCFFQAVLLAGYCYAHALNRLAPARWAPFIHLCLLGMAMLALPVGLPTGLADPPAGSTYVWLLGLLAAGVGLPFFAVSANAPLLQAWFARTGHPHAGDPYFLYGASNLGSLAALLLYPVLIEPFIGLGSQSAMWTAGFVGLGLMIAASGLTMVMSQRPASERFEAAPRALAPAITWTSRLVWIGLAAVPSGLLVAFTSYVTTDIASAPFLWVLPLAAFLATFILVFRPIPVISHRLMLMLQPVTVIAVLFGISTPGSTGWVMAAIGGSVAFLVTTMVCHKELYDRRPAPARLTEFYLWMSFGGVLGGVFAAIVAPQIFNTIWEFPILVVLGMACRPGVAEDLRNSDRRELLLLAIGGLVALMAVEWLMIKQVLPVSQTPRLLALVACAILAVLASGRPLRQLVLMAIAGMSISILPSAMNRGHAERSFFGVHRIAMLGKNEMRVLFHGTTIHGAERIRHADGTPVAAPVPATYYYPGSPMARAADVARAVSGKPPASFQAAVVGLGTGALACSAREGEAWRFYEIDPLVARIARDRGKFSFLSRCQPTAEIVLGDARLTLEKAPAGSLDYLVIDAFASDAVPVHLMTREAMTLYLSKLAPDGILALHVSNRHLDLHSVATSTAKSLAGTLVALADDRFSDAGLDRSPSHVVLVTRSAKTFAEVLKLPYASEVKAATVRPWTDDYSDILGALWRNARR